MRVASDYLGRPLAACCSVAIVVMMILLIGGCNGNGSGSQVSAGSSVTELLGKLPNLQPYGIESCDYTVEKSSASSRMPSPSDIRVELRGSAKLSESGFGSMKSKFTWGAIPREKIPKALADTAPVGNLLYSQKLNESFADNPTFAHGFVVVPEQEGARTVYFLATDIDHPIR